MLKLRYHYHNQVQTLCELRGYNQSQARLFRVFLATIVILVIGSVIPSAITIVSFPFKSSESMTSVASLSTLILILGYVLKTGDYFRPAMVVVILGSFAIVAAGITQPYILNNSIIWFAVLPLFSMLFLGLRKGAW